MSNIKVKKVPSFKAYEIISRLSLFSDLLPDEIRILSDNQQIFYQIPAGEIFISQGEVENNFYLLLSGTAKVMQDNPTLLRLKELEVLERVTERVDQLTVYGGLDGLMKQIHLGQSK